MTYRSLVNGRDSRQLDIQDRGLAYGDGVFETIAVVSGKAQWLQLHLQRLHSGCQRLQIALDTAALEREIAQLLAGCDDDPAVLKIIVSRQSPDQRGYRFDPAATSNRYLQLQASTPGARADWQRGISLRLCRHRLPINPPLAGIKHLNRLDNIIARAEWDDAEIAEGVMLDSEGWVIEGTMSNLFIERGDTLLTPALQRCGVAGVIRRLIIDTLAPQQGIRVEETALSVAELAAAPALFICNSLIGICPVTALQEEASPVLQEEASPALQARPVGTLTARLQRALAEAAVHG